MGHAGPARRHEHRQRIERRLGAVVERFPAHRLYRHPISAAKATRSSTRFSPPGFDPALQKATYDLVGDLNRQRSARSATRRSPRASPPMRWRRFPIFRARADGLHRRIEGNARPHGCDPPPSRASPRSCLLARRMIERGVRFVNIYHEGWDAHSNVEGNIRNNCGATDQASAALVADLKRRGMLEDTLVIWGGELGAPRWSKPTRCSGALGATTTRKAPHDVDTAGSIKPGFSLGATDEFGFHPVEGAVHVHDIQATILHCLGFDHERLTFHHAGRDYRLTGCARQGGQGIARLVSPATAFAWRV
ncbi:MAG: DUF1501 domain-containing protein [Verrucomicrobiales bacterium]